MSLEPSKVLGCGPTGSTDARECILKDRAQAFYSYFLLTSRPFLHTTTVQGWSEPCPVVNGTRFCRVDFSNICWFYGRDLYSSLVSFCFLLVLVALLESSPTTASHHNCLLQRREHSAWRDRLA